MIGVVATQRDETSAPPHRPRHPQPSRRFLSPLTLSDQPPEGTLLMSGWVRPAR